MEYDMLLNIQVFIVEVCFIFSFLLSFLISCGEGSVRTEYIIACY
jgi:hypothetical protein